jgi:preprotein translocase subunit SecB
MTQEVKFQIKNIELLDFALKQPDLPLSEETKYKFNINTEQKFNESEHLVAVTTTINIIREADQQMQGVISANCIYQVENLNQYANEKTKTIQLPAQFNTTLISISLSTTRGIMFSQFRGTFLHNAILPIINPTDFTKEI